MNSGRASSSFYLVVRDYSALDMRRKRVTKAELAHKFCEYDRKYFHDFFADKKVEIVIEDFCQDCMKDWLAYACAEDKTIGFNKKDLCRPKTKVYNALLHEMIHLLVCWGTPNGRRVWGDKCKVFKNMCRAYKVRRKY